MGDRRSKLPPTPADYQIKVRGRLDPRWSTWFEGFSITCDAAGDTIIAGRVVDQAVLYGLLSKARDLSLTLLAVCRVETDRQGEGGDKSPAG